MIRYGILAWRYLWGRKLRTFLTTLAITLGVMVLFGLSSLVPSMAQAFRQQMLGSVGVVDITLSHVSGGPFTAQMVETARSTEGVARAAGLLRQSILLPGPVPSAKAGLGTTGNAITLTGVDVDPQQQTHAFDVVQGRALQPDDRYAALISESFAESQGLTVGDDLRLPGAKGQVDLQVVGIVRKPPVPGNEVVYVPLATAQEMLNLPGLVNAIEVIVRAGEDRAAVQERLLQRLGAGFTTAPAEFGQEFEAAIRLGEQIMQIFGLLAIIMGGFIIFNTFRTLVAERRHDLGMLRAIGATRRMILSLVLVESLLQGVLGTLLGLVAGYAMAWGTVAIVRPTLHEYMRFDIGAPVFSTQNLVLAVVMGIGVTLLGGLWPALSATRLTPLDALRPTLPPVQRWQARLRTWVGVALLGFSCLGLISNEVGLSALGVFLFIVGLILVSPALVSPLANALSRVLAFMLAREGHLARGNVERQPARAAITASTVMISLAIIVASGGVVTSINQGLYHYIDQSLGSDLLILPSALMLGANNLGASPELAAAVRQTPGIADVTTLRLGKSMVDGTALQVIGIDPQTYPEISGLIFSAGKPEEAFAALGRERAVILNGIYAVQSGVKVGQTLTLQTPEGPRDYTVVGIGVDFLNAKVATAYISQENLARDFHITTDVLIMANLAAGAQAEAVKASLQSLLKDYPTFTLMDSRSFRESTLRSSQAGFVMLYVIMLVLALPSLLGMINTLAINVIERTREIGLLRAIGSTRRQIRRMIRAESLILAGMGTAFGLIAGVWLGYVLVAAMNSGGFPMPYTFPYAGIMLGLAGGILLGVLAAGVPARQAAHLDIISALRYE